MEKASIIIALSEDDCIESYLSNDKYKNKIEKESLSWAFISCQKSL